MSFFTMWRHLQSCRTQEPGVTLSHLNFTGRENIYYLGPFAQLDVAGDFVPQIGSQLLSELGQVG